MVENKENKIVSILPNEEDLCSFGSLMTIGERILRRRDDLKLTRETVGIRAGIDPRTLGNIENGKSLPRTDNLQAIASALETSVAYLVGETDNPSLGIFEKRPKIDTSEFEGIVPKETIDRIVNAPFRASIDEEMARGMKDEEILLALQETQERIILYKLRDELKKELERRKNK